VAEFLQWIKLLKKEEKEKIIGPNY